MKKFLAAFLILLTNSAAAQEISPEVNRGIESVKQTKSEFGAEARTFDSSPEFILRYKNFSLDYIRSRKDFNFLKLKTDKEIFSLMGTGLEWNVALNSVDSHDTFYLSPSVGINFYMRVRPRLDVYAQISGLPLGRYGHFEDCEYGIKYFPQRNFSISAGRRRIDFKARHGSFISSGWFVGARYDF